MIQFESWFLSIVLFVLLHDATSDENGPSYDTNDWIPIVPESTKATRRESKSSDRILNVGLSGEKYLGDENFPFKKTHLNPHKLKLNPHIKRSPNQRPRIKLDQPYRFENILAPPPRQQVRGFQQKNPFQSTFNFQPQYQFNIPKPSHSVNQQTFQQFPVPSNPSIYNLNNLQAGPSLPSYSPTQFGVSYQQPNFIHTIPSKNNTVFGNSITSSVHQGLFETTAVQSPDKNLKLPAQAPSEEKDSVQLLYVPLEQLQNQQSINSGILDEAFKSLQQQKLVAPPPENNLKVKDTESIRHHPQQTENEPIQQHRLQSHDQQINKQVYSTIQSQSSANEDRQLPQQYYILQNNPRQKNQERPTHYELVSKNQGELILQNNPKTVEVSSKQEYQVQAEKQQIVELTSPQPVLNHQAHYNSPFEHQEKLNHQGEHREQQLQDSRVQGTRNYINKEPQRDQSFVVQNQVSQPFSVDAPRLQQSYVVQNDPRTPTQQNHLQDDQRFRLQNIQKDIHQQTLQVEKLQKQIQQGKSIDFQGNDNSKPLKKRKPHQPPLAVYMEGNQPGDVESVLEVLKNAKSIAVQDQVGPNSPQVFIGPSNLSVPKGFAKFPLPYLSSLDNNRIQRKAQQFPFFVAPINYKEPEGYSKIPLPSPHVGSVVVSQFKQKPFSQFNNNFEENNRPVPITNYKFVNPSFETGSGSNSHFDDNLNAYSLESGNPRDNPNRHIKEQTLFQQITGFSGFDYPQQYFNEGRPTEFSQIPETISSTSRPTNDQYLKEVYQRTEETSPISIPQEIPARTVSSSGRQRTRGEKIRGSKKGSDIQKESNDSGRSEKTTTEQATPNPEITIPEVPTPNIVHVPEKVEISSQNPLTQDFLNRFSSNNNFNFNYVSSTPGYAIPTQSSEEELPANIRKLQPIQGISNNKNQQLDAQFGQSIQTLQNSKERIPSNQDEQRVHVYNQYEQFELPTQLTEINPNLPGLINELEQQNKFTTGKYQENPPVPTTQSTTQFTIKTTEATTTTSTTTRRSRGRGRGRFNMKTTTSSPYRRNPSGRRRPIKTTTVPTTESSYENSGQSQIQNERSRSRSRLQNTLTERLAEGSIESTSTYQQLLQPSTRVMDISQNQPNYYVQFQSSVDNVKPVLRDYVEEPKTETARFVEQYQSQKVTTAEELASQDRKQSLNRQSAVTQSDKSELTDFAATQKTAEDEKPTRKRVRVRGRPKNKYSSTTIAPRTSSPPEKEENEFYGFFRQPNFSQSSQISNSNRNEEESIHIYAPTQQKTPVYNPRIIEPIGPTDPPADQGKPRFIGELRPKYASPSRATTTTQLPETTQRRIRGRVRVPGRSYESKTTTADASSTERSVRGRVRGRTHFTPPRNIREESENEETENYPAPFLRSRETATAPSSSEFKITVSMDNDREYQTSHSSMNRPENLSTEEFNSIGYAQDGSKIYRYEEPEDNKQISSSRGETKNGYSKKDGFRVVNLDQFDTAESQNYRSLFNSLDSPYKVNDLKSKEIDEKSKEIDEKSTEIPSTSSPLEPEVTTVLIQNTTEDDAVPTTEVPESQNTSLDDLNSTILESVLDTIGNSTMPFHPTTTSETAMETTTENFIKDLIDTSAEESTENLSKTTVASAEAKITDQSPMDLLNLQTSTSTEVSHETEICYKGRCVKSRNKKLRKRLLRKKVNETNV